jgi:hypothetical protein
MDKYWINSLAMKRNMHWSVIEMVVMAPPPFGSFSGQHGNACDCHFTHQGKTCATFLP